MPRRSCRRRSSSPTSRAAASTARCCRSCRSTRDGSVNVSRLAAKPHVTAGCGGFVDITARAKQIVFSGYFTAGAKLARRGRPAAHRRRGQGQEARARGRARLVQRQARRRAGPGGHLRHRALRDAADARRHHRHRAGARASISSATCWRRRRSRSRSPSDLRTMDAQLFRPEPFGLRAADDRMAERARRDRRGRSRPSPSLGRPSSTR